MPNALSATFQLKFLANLVTDFGTLSPNISRVITLTNGTLINQVNLEYVKKGSVASGSPDTYDLSGSLVDAAGVAAVFVKVVGIAVVNLSVTAGQNLVVGGGSNPFINWVGSAAHTVTVGPGGWMANFNPSLAAFGVTAATGDILQIASASGTIDYIVGIIGRNA